MGYKSYASLVIALSIFALPTVADVMDEYRDPSFTGGYVVGEYLFDKTSEQDQKSLSIYGEYDVSAYANLYYRAQQAKSRIKPSMVRCRTKPRTLTIYRLLVHGFGIVLVKMTSMK